ncbi:ABC transporter permease [Thermococcus bergensis]|jgi:ABC-2 type transport system permease protein|uniref:ABC transporter permease n=1 Tax=Thermococcus bergensis TaxID=2689387 RepID=UPI001CED795E|nr:ABC transporter permease [Thermococcus bergensis]MCA6214326.1 ABC transporter permease [Thermococcus bergensis]
MSDFWILVMKELKDLLRDKGLIFGIIIVPLIIYPALGQMMQVGFEQAQEETKVVLVNLDEGQYGDLLIKALEAAPNVTLTKIEALSVDEALQKAQEENYNMIVIIPQNFSRAIENNQKAQVEVYGIIRGISGGMREAVSEGRINAVLTVLNEYLAKLKIQQNMEGDPEAILKPIDAKSFTVIKGRVVAIPPSLVANLITSQSFSMPIVIFIMIILVAQMSAGSMAMEKENKTLETLLTLPVKRITIVAGKMVGTAVIGIIAAIAYMIGMRNYLGSLTSSAQVGITLEELGLTVTPQGAALFVLIMFLAMIFALSFAMLLAVFAEDTKSANTVVSAGIMPLTFPTFILMFADLETLPLAIKYLLLAIPFSHPILASRAMLMGEYSTMYASAVYLGVLSVLMLLITARFFTTEKLLTAKLRLRRRG